MDVEFDSVEDVPDILNALKVRLNVEKFNEKNDRIRSASLLPKQLRDAKARKAKLLEAEKDWVAKGSSKKLAAETLQFMKGASALPRPALPRPAPPRPSPPPPPPPSIARRGAS